MPKYILDTDICIYWLKGDRQIERTVLQKKLENVYMTVITECELYYGAYKSARSDKNISLLRKLRSKIKSIQTTSEVPRLYGKWKANLERIGQRLDDADLLIACITIASRGILVTNNISDFKRIPNLAIENWKS